MGWFDVLKVAAPNLQQRAGIATTPRNLQRLRQRNIQSQNAPLPKEPKIVKPEEQTEFGIGDISGEDASDVGEAERRLAEHKPLLDKPGHGRHRTEMANIAIKILEARDKPTEASKLLYEAEEEIEAII